MVLITNNLFDLNLIRTVRKHRWGKSIIWRENDYGGDAGHSRKRKHGYGWGWSICCTSIFLSIRMLCQHGCRGASYLPVRGKLNDLIWLYGSPFNLIRCACMAIGDDKRIALCGSLSIRMKSIDQNEIILLLVQAVHGVVFISATFVFFKKIKKLPNREIASATTSRW